MIRMLLSRPLHRPISLVPSTSLSQNLFRGHERSISRVPGTLLERMEVSTYKNSPYDIRTFCTHKDLSTKRCVPCNVTNLQPMTQQEANELQSKVPGWSLGDEGGKLKLNRSWKTKSFLKGLELLQMVADVAEAEGHHPDLHLVGWNNVNIEIWTHAVGGLTENDFILAAKINGLELTPLLRRKVTTN